MASYSDQYIQLLQPRDLDDLKRLHKYAAQEGRPVFAQYGNDTAMVLEAAANGIGGAFGIAVHAVDHDEPGEQPELVGALTAQVQQQPQQQGGGQLVLLTLVVRADVRQQGVGRMLLQALLEHAAQLRASGQPCARLVADVALSNRQAWSFFAAMGFTRGSANGQTAEARLALEAGGYQPPQARGLPPTAAASLASRHLASHRSGQNSTGCSASTCVLPMRRPGVQHLARPAVVRKGVHKAQRPKLLVRGVCACLR